MQMKKKHVLIFGLPVLVVLIVLAFFVFDSNGKNGIKYKTEPLKKGNIEALVSTTGTVNPVTIVEVGSQVSGRIAKLYVDFNSKVMAGQLVAEIDPSQIETRIKQNEANHESAKASLEKEKVNLHNIEKKYQRALKLFEKELISFEEKENLEAQFKSAQADVRSAEARLLQSKSQLESAKVDLSYTKIISPIDGVVILRNVNVGQTVAASFQAPVLFKIANDLKKMQVECSIDEADIGKVKEGQEVKFTVDAFPEESFSGKVTQVRFSPEVVQNVVTYTTIVETDNSRLKLRPGMTATVSIVTGKATDVLIVPNSALRFNPPLTQEQMREIFVKMRQERMAGRQGNGTSTRSQGSSSNRTGMAGGFFTGRQPGAQGQRPTGRRANFGRIWTLDANQQLKMVFVRTGVTDDTNTEIKRSNLKEGQLIITGILSGNSSTNSSRSDLRRSSRMFFRR